MNKRILVEWEIYRKVVVPADAEEVQVEETRRAFYGGAQTLMSIVVGAISDDREPTPEDIKVMDELDAELKEYIVEMKAKYGLA